MWASFYASLRAFNVKVEACPATYTGHVDFFHQKLVRILQDAPCHEYYFVMDKKPMNKYRIFPEYKKGRTKIEFDPKPATISSLMEWGAKVIWSEDNEADDCIASYIAENVDKPFCVATTDKDLWQLCDIPSVRVYNFLKGSFVDKDALKEAYDLEEYTHIKLHKALWGDPSDNVPNVAPRLQKSLMPIIKQTDGTLKGLWDKLDSGWDSLNPKAQAVISMNKDKIQLNYELVKLNFDCAFNVGHAGCTR
jgi:5'-3' exonuclease